MKIPSTEDLASQRLHSIDTAKGVGIFFVVFGHAWRGAYDAGLMPNETLYRAIDNLIYAWHMPLFFLLSGLLFVDGLSRSTAQGFVTSRVQRLLWPMALWTWIFFGMRWMAGAFANHPVSGADIPLIPLPPYEHLWFLWAMFLVQFAAAPLVLALRPVQARWILPVALGGLALGMAILMPTIKVPSLYFGAAIKHMPYFLAGIALGSFAHWRPPFWFATLAVGLLAVLFYGATQAWASVLQSLDIVVLIWVIIAYLDRNAVQVGPVLSVLRRFGQASMAIFLAHTIFSAGLRIVMLELGLTSLSLHLVAATVIGLVGPIAMLKVTDRLGLTKGLGL